MLRIAPNVARFAALGLLLVAPSGCGDSRLGGPGGMSPPGSESAGAPGKPTDPPSPHVDKDGQPGEIGTGAK